MLLSYTFRRLGLTIREVEVVRKKNLFLTKELGRQDEPYLNLNQQVLGRRLRDGEKSARSLDRLVLKMYEEFGSQAFVAVSFASFIKNYLQLFSEMTGRFQQAVVTLFMDNDKSVEVFDKPLSCTITYQTFQNIAGSTLTSGLLSGEGAGPWGQLGAGQKLDTIHLLLSISPLIVEVPRHAFLISGYSNEGGGTFLLNDPLSRNPRWVDAWGLLQHLTSIVMMVEVAIV